MAILRLQVSERLVEIAVDGGPLTKGELAILKAYLDIQEKIAPAQRVKPDKDEAEEDTNPYGDWWLEPVTCLLGR